MGMEIEKKYLVSDVPFDLEKLEKKIIEQGYLNQKPVVRVRRSNDKYYMTYKGEGLMAREEYNLPLNEEAYNHLVSKCDGHIIKKTRYIIPIENDLVVELDVFDYPKGLVMAEVEFPDIETANSFNPPSWFIKEVTEDPKYHNVNMI